MVESSVTNKTRKVRKDKGRRQLTNRDISVFRWIGEQYAVGIDQLVHVVALLTPEEDITWLKQLPSKRAIERLVYERWTKGGLSAGGKNVPWVQVAKLHTAYPTWVYLTNAGYKACGLDCKEFGELTQLGHVYDVNCVRIYLQNTVSKGIWVSGREVNSVRRLEKKHHTVDAELVLGEQRVGIEVERRRKRQSRYKTIFRELDQDYDAIWYFVTPEAKNTIVNARENMAPNPKKFQIYDMPDLPKIGEV